MHMNSIMLLEEEYIAQLGIQLLDIHMIYHLIEVNQLEQDL